MSATLSLRSTGLSLSLSPVYYRPLSPVYPHAKSHDAKSHDAKTYALHMALPNRSFLGKIDR